MADKAVKKLVKCALMDPLLEKILKEIVNLTLVLRFNTVMYSRDVQMDMNATSLKMKITQFAGLGTHAKNVVQRNVQ